MTVTVNDPNLGEVERTFDLHLPAGYSPDNDLETPLWLDFHGAGFVIGDKNSTELCKNDTAKFRVIPPTLAETADRQDVAGLRSLAVLITYRKNSNRQE